LAGSFLPFCHAVVYLYPSLFHRVERERGVSFLSTVETSSLERLILRRDEFFQIWFFRLENFLVFLLLPVEEARILHKEEVVSPSQNVPPA